MDWKKFAYGFVACLSACFAFAIVAAFLGRVAAEGQMLAGGAIVAFYMLIGGLFGMFLTGFLAWRWRRVQVGKLALGMLAFALCMLLVVYIDIRRRQVNKGPEHSFLPSTASPLTTLSLAPG